MRFTLLIFVCCLGLQHPRAMEPWFVAREIDEIYTNLSVNLMYQDRNCMIWLGTSEGLMQYNGSQLDPIRFPDLTTGLSVTALYEDHLGTLWAGTESGRIYQYTARQGLVEWSVEEGSP